MADPVLDSTAPPSVTTRPAASADNVIRPTGAGVIPLSVRGSARQPANLQQWESASGGVLASLTGDGRRLRLATPTGAPMRIQTWEQASGDGVTNRVLSLSYNREIRDSDSYADDPAQPATTLQLESWWYGTSELDWDITGTSGVNRRPFGANASYDGEIAGFALGTSMASGAGGVELWGGTKPDGRHLRVYERKGGNSLDNLFVVYRGDRASTSFAWRGGGIPRWTFALDGVTNALSMGSWGALRFGKALVTQGEPLVNFHENGPTQVLLASYPSGSDSKPRFALLGDGRNEWGPGLAAPADTNLFRAAPALLRTEQVFQAYGGVATEILTRRPTDADFASPQDGLMAVDSTALVLYIRTAGAWLGLQLV